MNSEEISQDLICLLVGVTATIVSGVGIYTVKFISNRWNSKSPKIVDVIRKKLNKPPQQSKSSKQDLAMRSDVSPLNSVLLHSDPIIWESSSLDGSKEVDVNLDIRKAEDNSNNFDVQLGIVADPESEDPMKIQVDATFDKEMNVANVRGKAKSKADGSVKIEGQLENKRKIITLDPKKDSTSKMVLRKR